MLNANDFETEDPTVVEPHQTLAQVAAQWKAEQRAEQQRIESMVAALARGTREWGKK